MPQSNKRQPTFKANRTFLHHFFASSVAAWLTNEDPEKLIQDMKRQGLDFNLFYVPLPQTAEYEIRNHAPTVEGTKFLGYWGFTEE